MDKAKVTLAYSQDWNGALPQSGQPDQPDASFKHGSGSGGGDGMSERLDRLEKKVDSIESTLSRLNETMARVESKFDVITLKFDGVDKRFESSNKTLTDKIESSNKALIDKIDSSTKLNESNIRAGLAEAKLAIILAIPAILGVVYTAYRLLTKQ